MGDNQETYTDETPVAKSPITDNVKTLLTYRLKLVGYEEKRAMHKKASLDNVYFENAKYSSFAFEKVPMIPLDVDNVVGMFELDASLPMRFAEPFIDALDSYAKEILLKKWKINSILMT